MKMYMLAINAELEKQPSNHYGHLTSMPNLRLYHNINPEVFNDFKDLRDDLYKTITEVNDEGEEYQVFDPCSTIESIQAHTFTEEECVSLTVNECRILNGCLQEKGIV